MIFIVFVDWNNICLIAEGGNELYIEYPRIDKSKVKSQIQKWQFWDSGIRAVTIFLWATIYYIQHKVQVDIARTEKRYQIPRACPYRLHV